MAREHDGNEIITLLKEFLLARSHVLEIGSGGIVCHTFWKGEDSETYNDLFVNYHSDTGLRELFEARFEPLLIKYYQEFEKGDSILFYINSSQRG